MILGVIVGFIAFFSLHAVSLRLLPRPRTVYRVLLTLVESWAGGMVITWFLVHDAFTLVLLTLVVVCYVLGVFAIVDSSVHVRILCLIARARSGMTKKELLARYNRETVVAGRLVRLVEAGEIRSRRGTYRLAKSTSLLLARERLSRIMEWLFP